MGLKQYITYFIIIQAISNGFNAKDLKTGLKFSLNTSYAKLLENLDLNSLIKNKELVPTPIVDKNFIYSVSLNSLMIDNITFPNHITVDNIEKNESTRINLFNITVNLAASIEIRVGLIKTKYDKLPITVIIDKVVCEYQFINGNVNFKRLNYDIKTIDIKFPSVIVDIIYKMSKFIIIKIIEGKSKSIQTSVQEAINKFIQEDTILQAPMGTLLFFDATSTSSPELFFPKAKKLEFLQSNADTLAFLRFGIKGRIFTSKDEVDNLPAPAEMEFSESSTNKGVSLLLSDYTLNTMADLLQKSGKLSVKYSGSNTLNGYDLDSISLQKLVPELSMYTEAKDCFIGIEIPMLKYPQPLIYTTNGRMIIKLKFQFRLNVQEDPDPFEDSVTVLLTDNTIDIEIHPVILNNLLFIQIIGHNLKEIELKDSTFATFDQNRFKANLNDFIKAYLTQAEKSYMGIDINKIINTTLKTPFSLQNLSFDLYEGYSSLSFDVNKN